MATVTPNFNWPVPTSTDLVKDGATAIEALGDSIDGSLVDLKGGTTGQVLSKTSGTDMDFTWVTSDDANAIQNSIVNAKGDLIGASANDTPAILSVGANGETLVADSSTSTGLRWQGSMAAGKNVVINGGFDNWQRGTTFTNLHGYNADRFLATGATAVPIQVISRQTITPGDLSGVGLQYFWRQNVTNVNSATNISNQTRIEDVTTFAGQTVTLSFYAKADSARTITMSLNQNFGSGGSGDYFGANNSFTLSTTWTRYSVTVALPSISGKTIGASNFLYINATMPLSTFTIDWTGIQLELGSVATQFSRAGGTIQGELSACQRYYNRFNRGPLSTMTYYTSTLGYPAISLPVEMRIAPTAIGISSATAIATFVNGSRRDSTAIAYNDSTTKSFNISVTTSAATAGQAGGCDLNTSAWLEVSAEL